MMKKIITLSIFTLFIVSSLVGCKKTKTDPVQIKVSEETKKKSANDTKVVDITPEGETTSTEEINMDNLFNDMIMVSDTGYSDYDYFEAEDIFTVNNIETVDDKSSKGVTVIYAKAEGSISGLPGTFKVDLPYTLNWKMGDRALVLYKKAYDEENDIILVSDIVFEEKTEITIKSRKERLAEEKALEESIQESIKAEEEARIKEEAEKEAKKKKEQEEYQARQAEAARVRRLAEEAAAQKLIEESIAESKRIQAEEDAKKTKVIVREENTITPIS